MPPGIVFALLILAVLCLPVLIGAMLDQDWELAGFAALIIGYSVVMFVRLIKETI